MIIKKPLYHEYYDDNNSFNLPRFLHFKSEYPLPLSVNNFHKKIDKKFIEFLKSKDFVILCKIYSFQKTQGTLYFYNEKNNIGVEIYFSKKPNKHQDDYMEIEYDLNSEVQYNLQKIHHLIDDNLVKELEIQFDSYFIPEINKRYINFLAKNSNGTFYINKIELDKVIDIDFNTNYNDDFDHKKIEKYINSKTNGLILLGGIAGSGKSYYIKYLIHNLDRPFLYIPNEYLSLLTSPDFINFAITNLIDYVLILEDAENVLLSRETSKSSAVPTILNLTSGIIGDILNLTIIGTYNTKDQIDNALFRKGRLLYEYHFDNLNVVKCNLLAKKLNNKVVYTESVPLAEIYNPEDNGNKKEGIKTIGYYI